MNQKTPGTILVIFAKAPKPGFAKTRLIPQLGADGAAQLATQLLHHTVSVACSTHFEMIDLCITPCPPDPLFKTISSAENLTLSCQTDGDLGQRMSAAFFKHLECTPKVLLIGTDAPNLTVGMLHEASRLLDAHDAVFIPALDGGYTMIGLRKHHPSLFSNIPWSTASVMTATRAALRKAKLSWAEMTPLPDIDEPQDLVHLPGDWTR
ncbi:glycosyltransferase [Pusillimonas sp. DMV24BSW_D]|uniref:TIGR04282 family arsenosugar biosynthesis glycosyltransferase n=1 Tax=Neopusillimonas aestuarii TaxID=2716226 RepID=UPI001407BEE2|nr:TIGR04282 family arsenosugar biosynthesis glycosyltransferase [Pusillimonas sp. DMV24BSW_D]QIM50342.1 glycosyltransferase [Pusillimonas sp. DMV24BSW_D]